jgi:hypothetical protein
MLPRSRADRLWTSGSGRTRPSVLSRRLRLLSWGFPKIPLHRDPDRASTPGRLPVLRPGVATSVLVPPLPFLPASTVSSARPLAGLLHPAPDPGVRSVSGSCRGPSPPRGGAHQRRSPPRNRASHPSELCSSSTAVPRHRGPCLPVLRSDPHRSATEAATSRPSSADESGIGHPALPPRPTRCSPGLRSPSGSSPNAAPCPGHPARSRALDPWPGPPVGFDRRGLAPCLLPSFGDR